jgi:scyllo-inositol 2-dehydrogenase (NADP+)
VTLSISSIDSNPKRGFLEVTGTKGTYLIEWGNWEVTTHEDGKTIITKGKHPESEGWKHYQNVADHMVKGEKLIITGEWARRPIHILDLANQSARQGKALKAKYS